MGQLHEKYLQVVRDIAQKAINDAQLTPQKANDLMSQVKDYVHQLENSNEAIFKKIDYDINQRIQFALNTSKTASLKKQTHS